MESGDAEKLLEFSWPDALCWNAWSPPQHHGICSTLPDDAPQLSSRKLSLTPCFTWQIPQSIITKANKTPQSNMSLSELHLEMYLQLPSEPPRQCLFYKKGK